MTIAERLQLKTMQSVKDTIQRRDRTGRRSIHLLQRAALSDGNNNCVQKQTSRSPSPDKPKAEKKMKQKNKKKEKGRNLRSNKAKNKRVRYSLKTPPKQERKVADTFTETIGDTEVIVNLVVLEDAKEEKDIHLATENPLTPVNYSRTVEYYRYINDARVAYLRAADYAGDLLLRGEVEGDADAWEEYSQQKREEVKKWRKESEDRHAMRTKDSRKVEEGEGTCSFVIKRFGRMAKAWLWNEFVDIFPCCVPE